jgi:hypothetical protein
MELTARQREIIDRLRELNEGLEYYRQPRSPDEAERHIMSYPEFQEWGKREDEVITLLKELTESA